MKAFKFMFNSIKINVVLEAISQGFLMRDIYGNLIDISFYDLNYGICLLNPCANPMNLMLLLIDNLPV